MARKIYHVTRKRINGPRKSRVRVGPVPFILFLGVAVLVAVVDLVWVEPGVRGAAGASGHGAAAGSPKTTHH
ncbi:MAG TPA: hypothetical protein VN932_09130 [Rhizomicrobium sp.]|nr:hypothetical protein [Rhizomicrobium sp.]